jgi:hypothetical protein
MRPFRVLLFGIGKVNGRKKRSATSCPMQAKVHNKSIPTLHLQNTSLKISIYAVSWDIDMLKLSCTACRKQHRWFVVSEYIILLKYPISTSRTARMGSLLDVPPWPPSFNHLVSQSRRSITSLDRSKKFSSELEMSLNRKCMPACRWFKTFLIKIEKDRIQRMLPAVPKNLKR